MATVMVVDDTESSRRVVSRLLRAEGHNPVCANNGLEALSVLQHIKPDVVLLDVLMPVMDGLTFLEILRQDPQYQALPVILMSSLSDKDSMARAKNLGAKEYLVKASFSANEMLRHVERYSRVH